jgi:hypothetical protein
VTALICLSGSVITPADRHEDLADRRDHRLGGQEQSESTDITLEHQRGRVGMTRINRVVFSFDLQIGSVNASSNRDDVFDSSTPAAMSSSTDPMFCGLRKNDNRRGIGNSRLARSRPDVILLFKIVPALLVRLGNHNLPHAFQPHPSDQCLSHVAAADPKPIMLTPLPQTMPCLSAPWLRPLQLQRQSHGHAHRKLRHLDAVSFSFITQLAEALRKYGPRLFPGRDHRGHGHQSLKPQNPALPDMAEERQQVLLRNSLLALFGESFTSTRTRCTLPIFAA